MTTLASRPWRWRAARAGPEARVPAACRSAVLAALAITLAASPVAAQTPTFAEVAPRLRPGTPVQFDIDGTRVEGDVERATPDGLVIRRGPARDTFVVPLERLQAITYGDSNRNGGVIGLVVGVVPGAVMGTVGSWLCENEGGNCDAAPFVLGAISGVFGLGIGVAIDELIKTTVRFGPRGATAAVSLAPDPRRPAAQLSIRF
jgi:hypothetical protein